MSFKKVLAPCAAVSLLALVMSFAVDAAAQQRILHALGNQDGTGLSGNLTLAPSGKIYGVAAVGGNSGCLIGTCGTIFELKRRSNSHHWGFKVIYKFGAVPDGSDALGGMAMDSAGNLYGTTYSGGNGRGQDCTSFGVDYGCGTVFELSPTPDGQWTEKVLHSFTANGIDGIEPTAGPILDSLGNLYGTTYWGGAYSFGTVWEMSPSDGGWTYKILYNFGAPGDAAGPYLSGLALDSAGNLYGATYVGGDYGWGTVYELVRGGDGSWTEKVLHSFSGDPDDGLFPYAGVTLDAAGNIYGTTHLGGIHDTGIVYKLAPAGDGTWAKTIVHNFTNGADGGDPQSTLTFDAAGNLYGTSKGGGSGGQGTVFKLIPQSDGTWAEQTLLNFNGGNGWDSNTGVLLDRHGNLYSGAQWGGGDPACVLFGFSGCGLVFQVEP